MESLLCGSARELVSGRTSGRENIILAGEKPLDAVKSWTRITEDVNRMNRNAA